MSKDTGGPAFPAHVKQFKVTASKCGGTVIEQEGEHYQYGMTIRDYFAAKAMQGIMTAQENRGNDPEVKCVANYSYEIADAMIAERNK